MSGQWEVVGRNKKEKLTNKKPGKPEKTAVVPPTKVEDVLPASQVKSLFQKNGKNNKENKKPQEKEKPKENVKKPPVKKTEKNTDSNKPKKHKSIESALNLIQIEDIKSAYETSKQRFPEAPLVWLKEISSFLNAKLAIDNVDPVFSDRPDGYPLSAIPAGIKQVMEKALQDAGKASAQLFFDLTLTAMANDMSKNHSALGHKLWIQYMAFNNPQLTVNNLQKHVVLRTSYLNRQPIGVSILWALGQGGAKDFSIGLKVFKEFMMPLFEMKNYTKYIVQYITQLLKRHESGKGQGSLSKENYLFLLDFIYTKHSVPNDISQQISSLSKHLKALVLSKGSEKKCSSLFESLLENVNKFSMNAAKNDICGTLVSFLIKDAHCYTIWKQVYAKHLQPSTNLLKYINEHWKKTSPQLDKKLFKDLVKAFVSSNVELASNPKTDQVLKEAISLCKILSDKMTVKKSFPWKSLSFLLIIVIGSLLTYDFNKNGGWRSSKSVKTLKDIGVWEYGEKTWGKAHEGLNWTRQRIEKYAPGYIDSASIGMQPYVELARDLGLIFYNFCEEYRLRIVENAPNVKAYFENYAPGFFEQAQNILSNVKTTVVEYWQRGYEYAATEIFVGQLSPENIQKVFWQSVTTAQQFATDGYHWVYEKIETTVGGK